MRGYTCVICPDGCDIRARIEEKEDGTRRICSVEGAVCLKGKVYVEQEVTALQRNIATSVLVKGGILPLTSVRLTNPILRDRIFDAMNEIKRRTSTAPMKVETVAMSRLLRYDTDVVMIKPVPENGCR